MTEYVKKLGSFNVVSSNIIVSDPCYERGIWCAGELENVLPGRWSASVATADMGDWGVRVTQLAIQHTDALNRHLLNRHVAMFDVAVDSGQAGFFDVAHFHDQSVVEEKTSWPHEDDYWYNQCCKVTLSPSQSGIIPFGVVSSSGFGDGIYTCYYYTDQAGKVVAAEIVFLTDEDWEED